MLDAENDIFILVWGLFFPGRFVPGLFIPQTVHPIIV